MGKNKKRKLSEKELAELYQKRINAESELIIYPEKIARERWEYIEKLNEECEEKLRAEGYNV